MCRSVSELECVSEYGSESLLAYALASQSASQSVYELAFPSVCWSVSRLACLSEYESGSLLASPSVFQSAFALE